MKPPSYLRSCPFCDGTANLYEWKPDPEMCTGFGAFTRYGVECSHCGAKGPFTDNSVDTGEEAIMLWNRRFRNAGG